MNENPISHDFQGYLHHISFPRHINTKVHTPIPWEGMNDKVYKPCGAESLDMYVTCAKDVFSGHPCDSVAIFNNRSNKVFGSDDVVIIGPNILGNG